MKDYDAYLFDWDGTLARTVELWIDQIFKRYEEYGLIITREQSAREFGDLKSPLKYGLPEHQLSEFQEGVNVAMKALLPDAPLYDDAISLLEMLKKQDKKLALVTTSLRHNLDIVIGKHDIGNYFDLIITSEDVSNHKPDPEGINLALDRLGVPKSRAIMIGDTDKDLLAATNAGIDSLLFYPDAHQLMYEFEHLQTHGPKYTVRAWQDFLEQLRQA